MRRLGEDEGATAVEYGLIAAGDGIAFIIAGPALADAFTDLLGVVLDHVLNDRPVATP